MSELIEAPILPEGYFFRIVPYQSSSFRYHWDIEILLMKRGYTIGKWFPKNYPNKEFSGTYSYSDKPQDIYDRMCDLKAKLERELAGPTKIRSVLGDYPPKKYIG